MTVTQHVFFIACVALSSYIQNLTGFAFGLVLLGLVELLHLASLHDATIAVSVLALVNAFVTFKSAKPTLDKVILKPTVLAGMAGVFGGVVLLNWLSDNAVAGLQFLLGLTILACATMLFIRPTSLKTMSPARSFAGVGFIAGIFGGLFSTAGPPLVYHFYRQPLRTQQIREHLIALFAINAALRLVLLAVDGRIGLQAVLLSAEAAPVVIGMTWFMVRNPSKLPPQIIKRFVCVLLVIVGLVLCAKVGS